MTIRTLDLFCGGGGSSWGAQAAGAEIVCGADAWNLATDAYRLNFPHARAVNVTLDHVSGLGSLGELGRIDLILASPECTNHTCARGRTDWCEKSRGTAHYVANFAEGLKPRWVVIENVVQMRNWDGYGPLLARMRGLGYRVRAQVLDASRFGVPQSRRRLFILCDREREPPDVRPRGGASRQARSILDAEGTWRTQPLRKVGRAQATLERSDRAIASLGEGVPFLVVYYGSDGAGGWQPLNRPLRTLTTLDRFGLVTWDSDTPMFRMLQVPELMRAMGFDRIRHCRSDPGNYTLEGIGTRRERIKLLGNGVCPPVMQAIVSALTSDVVRTSASPARRARRTEIPLAAI